MCGGVGFGIKNIPEKELKKYYSKEILNEIEVEERAESFFWHESPVLPIKTNKGVELKLWGNKDKDSKLPNTGWAREESIIEGKWNWLEPKPVDIAVLSGYEKKVWFDTPEGLKGILVKHGNEERVYIRTQDASEEYKKETGHDREPIGEKENYIKRD